MGRIYETAIKIGATISKSFRADTLSASAAVARLSRETKQLRQASALAERFTKQQGAAADRTANTLRKMGVDTAHLVSEQARLAGALAATERRMKLAGSVNAHFGKSLEKLSKGAGKYGSVEGSAGKVGSGLSGLAGDAAKLAGIGAAAGGALFAIAKSTAEAGRELDVTSLRLGTTTDALQLLRSAGRKTGVDIEALDTGLGKLAINLGKAASAHKKGGSGLVGEVGGLQLLGAGSGGAKAAVSDPFKHIGLNAQKLAALAPQEQVKQIADSFAKLKTHSEKAAAAVAIFGRGGLSMIPLLEKGGKGLEELFDQARASGNILSKETIENAKRFHLAYLATQGQLTGIKNTLGAALLPAVTNVLGQFNAWLKSNREQVKIWSAQLAAWIEGKAIPTIKNLIPQVTAIAKQLGGWIEKGVSLVGGLGNIGVALAALRLAPTGFAMASLAVNVGRLAIAFVPLAPAMLPFLATVGPILAVAAGLLAVYAAASKVASVIDDAHARKMKGEADLKNNLASEEYQKSDIHRAYVAKMNRQRAAERAAGGAGAVSPVAVPRTGAGGSMAIHHAPVIHIHGNASREDLDGAHRKAREDLETQMDRIHREKKRLGYGE